MVRQLKVPNIPINVLKPKHFEVCVAYKRMACDKFDRVKKDMTLDVHAIIGQGVARKADVDRASKSKQHHPVTQPTRGKPASFDARDRYLGIRKATTAGWHGYGQQG